MDYSLKKILVIDDDASLHDLCRAILGRFGFRCVSAFHGEEGLTKVIEEEPDLILLDLMMPGIDGQKVFETLLSDPIYQSYRNIPVIMLTAVSGDDVRKSELLSRGVAAYLSKPFGLNELVNVIQNVLITNEFKLRNLKLQEEISHAKQYLERIIDHAPLGIAVIDHDGKISRVNAFFAKMMGLGHPKDLIGRHILDQNLFSRPEIRDHFQRAIEKIEACSIPTIEMRNFAGLNLHVNIHCVPLRDDSGRLTGLLSIWEDVTEIEKRAYELSILRQISEAMQSVLDIDILLHLILTSITAGCALGFSRAIIFMVNEETKLLEGRMGVGPISAEAANHIWSELVKDHANLEKFLAKFGLTPPDEDDPFNREVKRLRIDMNHKKDILVNTVHGRQDYWIKDRGHFNSTGLTLMPDLAHFFNPEEFVTVPIIAKNRAIGVIIADNKYSSFPLREDQVSLLKLLANQAGLALENAEAYRKLGDKVEQLAEALRQLQDTQAKLVRSEQLATVGRMAAHVAHEIRNPLTAIGGFAKTILKKPQDTENVRLGAQIVTKEVLRLEKILKNVLNFTRISRPFKRLNNLNQVIQEIITLQQPVLNEGIKLELELADDIPDFCFDDEQMKQAMMNVLSNSVASIKNKGVVTIRTHCTEEQAVVEIADTGIGMSKDTLENIFNPFFTTRQDGTGLGLAVTQRVLEGHDGKIEVESRLKKGSVFRLILPLITFAEETIPAPGEAT